MNVYINAVEEIVTGILISFLTNLDIFQKQGCHVDLINAYAFVVNTLISIDTNKPA